MSGEFLSNDSQAEGFGSSQLALRDAVGGGGGGGEAMRGRVK